MSTPPRRFLVEHVPNAGEVVTLPGPQAEHVRVLRLRPGDSIVVFDAVGNEADVVLCEVEREHVSCEVTGPPRSRGQRGARIVLLLCMPKGAHLEAAIRMATELGVDEVRLCESERTVVHWSADRTKSRLSRLQRIAEEAAQQSERVGVPVMVAPTTLERSLQDVEEGALRWMFHARAGERPGEIPFDTSVIWIAIGPEGGFSPADLDLFREHRFSEVGLGDAILRVETAVSAALTVAVDRMRAEGPKPR